MTIIKADGVYLLNNKILRKRLIKSLEKSQNDGKITLRKTLMDETEKMIKELKYD